MLPEPCCQIPCRGARCWTFGVILLSIALGVYCAAYAVKNLCDPEFVPETFCQQNRFEKEHRGEEDIIDRWNSTCNSSVVLGYKPEDLGPKLRGLSVLQVFTGTGLAATGLPALAGVMFHRRQLLVPWLIADGIWTVSLIITAAILFKFGFKTFIGLLVGTMMLSLLSLGLVLYFYRKQRNGPGKPEAIPMQDRMIDE